jgi:hypothetical protein
VAKAALLLEGEEWKDVVNVGILPVFKLADRSDQ